MGRYAFFGIGFQAVYVYSIGQSCDICPPIVLEVLSRAKIAQRRMHTPSIVENLNIFKYAGLNTSKVNISFKIYPFLLYRGEEALTA